MATWGLYGLANAVIAVAYLVIGVVITRGLVSGGEWRRNALAVNTAAIFFSCSAGHGLHVANLVAGHSMDVSALPGGPLAVVDAITAGVAVSFLVQRLRHDAVAGNRMYDDLRERRQTALDLNDDVIQGLVITKLALDLDQTDEAQESIDRTIAASRQLVDQLLDGQGSERELRPGDLRRRNASVMR